MKKPKDFKGSMKKLMQLSWQILDCNYCSYDYLLAVSYRLQSVAGPKIMVKATTAFGRSDEKDCRNRRH